MLLRPLITLTTDFGSDTTYAGIMKGVIYGINPEAHVIDITHGITPHDIRNAAWVFGMSYKYFPNGTIHIVVVDPGVGSERRPILIITEKHMFIGPDNGVFSFVLKKERKSMKVIHLTSEQYFLSKTSSTFQGRDLFAPVAAFLSKGEQAASFGEIINDYVIIDLPTAKRSGQSIVGEIILIDKFGNCISNISRAEIENLSGKINVIFGNKVIPIKKYYSSSTGHELSAVINSSEYLELFVNMSNASELYSISVGDTVEVSFIEQPL